ncbi:AAA family ATPase [Sorangium sp. So ce375]|uniref:AAA family ATPase n=1 Tax=Sorangium sp. So ce375 TaxID=3133306 RepID=UPI003F5C50EA
MTAAAPYASSIEHLLAEVARVDLLLAVHAIAHAEPARARRASSAEERIHALLDRAAARAPAPSAAVLAARAEADRSAREIERRAAENARSGVPLRLAELAARFGLDRVDVDLLLATLAPEVPGTSSASAARPTASTVLAALLPSIEAQIAARRRLSRGAPLLRHALVHLDDEPANARLPLPARALSIDPRIAGFLFGDDALDARVAPYVRVTRPQGSLDALLMPAELKESLAGLVALEPRDGPSAIVTIAGPAGAGKRSLAAAICAASGRRLALVDTPALLAAGDDAVALLLPMILREAILADAALHWIDAGAALASPKTPAARALAGAIRAHAGLTFVSGAAPFAGALGSGDGRAAHVELQRPSAADQARLWARALGGDGVERVDLSALTSTFRLTGGQILEAAAAVKSQARLREPGARPTTADVAAACRSLHDQRIGSLARAIFPRHGWDDLVLPADKKALLRELCAQLRHRGRVLDEWGYERKLGLGKGLSALLSGPPGTGKTMAASVIAGELGVTLLHIDLSTVVSKYIGETEKHLAELFDSAEAANAALFFDEADALFGKRTEVRDAHDRYANLETSYLLQRVESYEGVVLLATNFMKNIDEAFVRRFAFVIELPFPNAADRLRIWRGIWTPETPLDADVDLAFLADRIELSGGYIRNIALAAAFIAAEEGKPVAMRHLLHATRREFQKMGKVVDAGFFDFPR